MKFSNSLGPYQHANIVQNNDFCCQQKWCKLNSNHKMMENALQKNRMLGGNTYPA